MVPRASGQHAHVAVRTALLDALEHKMCVTVTVSSAVAPGPPRTFEGVPTGFRPARDGRERVVLVLVEDQTEQLVLVERICRVVLTPR